MKRRLNILCLIVMLVLSYSVLEHGYNYFLGVKAGVNAGVEVTEKGSKQEDLQKLMNMKLISLMPHSFSVSNGAFFQDSVYNEKSGKYVPAVYSSMAVSVDNPSARTSAFMSSLLSLFQLGLYIWAIVLFIRLIISINKSDIFNWRNVRRLRYMGAALILGFSCLFLMAYLNYRSATEVFSLRGYDLIFSDLVDITMLVLGLCSLIVGEVFAIGLKMKEEQDLTI